jgi:hypothetical protein
MMVNVPTTAPVPRYVRLVRLVWLAGTGVSVLAALAAAVTMPSEVTVVLLVVTLAQAGVAVPACLAVARGKKWAWWVLVVLASASIGSLSTAWTARAWPSVLLNLVLGATLGLLQDGSVRRHVGKSRRPWRAD